MLEFLKTVMILFHSVLPRYFNTVALFFFQILQKAKVNWTIICADHNRKKVLNKSDLYSKIFNIRITQYLGISHP